MTLKKKFTEFSNEIEKSNNPIMFFDCDCDGFTSYIQIKKKWNKVIGYPFRKEKKYQLIDLEKIKKENDLVIFFDVPVICEEFLEKIDDKKMLWADHHIIDMKLTLKKYKNINYLNPLDYDKLDNRPSSFLANEVSNLKENIPFCFLGNLADFFLIESLKKFEKYDKDLFDKILELEKKEKNKIFKFMKDFKFNDKKTENERSDFIQSLLFKKNLYKIRNFIDFIFKLEKEKIIPTIRYLENLSLKELFEKLEDKNPKLEVFKKYNILMNDYSFLLKKVVYKIKLKNIISKLFNKKKQNYLFVEYHNKMSFTKTLIEELSFIFKDKNVFFVLQKKSYSKFYGFSLRGRNYDIRTLLLKSIKNLNAMGGGHKYACGGKVEKEDYEKFKKKLLSFLN